MSFSTEILCVALAYTVPLNVASESYLSPARSLTLATSTSFWLPFRTYSSPPPIPVPTRAVTTTPIIIFFAFPIGSPLFLKLTVTDHNYPLGMCCNIRIMSDHKNRNTFIIQLLEKLHNLSARLTVQCTSRLISQ